tara:strand:- start:545 stop:985 length:441 start_codon:yes stop_codon:yes gene_type:complete
MISWLRLEIKRNFKILGLEHVALAVESNKKIHNFFTDILNIDFLGSESVLSEKVDTSIYDVGNAKIETLMATDEQSVINKFIQKRGQSLHHIALLVDNIFEAIAYLNGVNIKLVYNEPRIGADKKIITFIDPIETPGLLIELCQDK